MNRSIMERVRWRIVYVLNRLPGQCWEDLASWALDGPRWKTWRPSQPIRYACRKDYAEKGSCYCGKLRKESEDGSQ